MQYSKLSRSDEVSSWLLHLILVFYCLIMVKTVEWAQCRTKMFVDGCWFFSFLSSNSFLCHVFASALVFSYDFHAGAETMFSRHFNDPAADSYFTKRKWGEYVFSPFVPTRWNRPTAATPATLCFTHLKLVYSFANEVISPGLFRCSFFMVCIACGCAHIRYLLA